MKMYQKYRWILFLAGIVLLITACDKNKNTTEKKVNHQYNYTEKYEVQWAKVDSLEKIRQFRSALNEVKNIKKLAFETENTPQGIKSILYELKYNTYLEEDDYELALAGLDSMANQATFPMKEILHSITAEVYQSYYQANQWKILERTTTEKFDNPDFKYWDAKHFEEKINEHYFLSLQPAQDLQQVSIEDFKEILEYRKETTPLRPTLYDFLAFRALRYFKQNTFSQTDAASQALFENENYFAEARDFVAIDFPSETNKDKVIKLFQDLIKFHLNDREGDALLHVDLMRIQFVYDNFDKDKREQLYTEYLQRLLEKYKNNPLITEVQLVLAKYHNTKGQNYNPQTGENRDELREAVKIAENALTNYPNTYAAKRCQDLIHQIERKEISVELANAVKPNAPSPMKITMRNVYNYHFRIVKMEWNEAISDREDYHLTLSKILNSPTIKTWQKSVVDPKDYHQHSTVLDIPALDFGHYAIIVSEVENPNYEKDIISYAKFWVTDLSLTFRNDLKSDQYTILHRQTGKPLNKVDVEMYEQKNYDSNYKAIKKFSPSTGGEFSWNNGKTYRNGFVHLQQGNDHYVERYRGGYRYDYPEEYQTKTHFFLDRAIFRPGQTVYFKGIKIRSKGNEHEVVKHTKTTVTLYDVNYQKVTSLTLTTNEFGSFNGSFVLPQGLLNGQMRIQDDNGSIFFSVEEYKRPKFEVNFNPVEGAFKLGEEVSVKGTAKAFAGFNLEEATVNYHVQRTARFPYWCWYRWGYMPTSPSLEIAHGEVKTNEEGEFTITFEAIPDKSIDEKFAPTYTYEITADVTDINGETRSATEFIQIGYHAMQISTDIKKEIDANSFHSITINATNLNGESIAAQGNITVNRLKEPNRLYRPPLWKAPDIHNFSEKEFHQLFPRDVYNNENNPGQWEKEQLILTTEFKTTKKGFLLSFDSDHHWKTGRYLLEISSLDSFGQKVEEIIVFTVYDPTQKVCKLHETDIFIPIKTEAEPGENAQFLIGTAEEEMHVLYEIEHQGKIIKKERLKLSGEQRLISIPVEEKYRGNFSVHFTAVKNNRIYKHDQTITVPYTNKELDIVFETFRNKLLPGQEEEWRLRIKGKNGDKVMAEMMTTLYDASLDEFRANDYLLNIWQSYYSKLSWSSLSFIKSIGRRNYLPEEYNYTPERTFSSLNWFGYNINSGFGRRGRGVYTEALEPMMMKTDANDMADDIEMDVAGNLAERKQNLESNVEKDETKTSKTPKSPSQVKARTNFNETAFFFPALTTNKDGEVVIKFTIPESLTRWKFLGLAHTQDLKVGRIEEEIVTQKKLMVTPNVPRFFRQGDELYLSTKITNLSDERLAGTVQLFLSDALTGQPIDSLFYSPGNIKDLSTNEFSLFPKKSKSSFWKIKIPENVDVVTYKIVAVAGNYSDGEEMAIPVLSNRMLVTESLPLPIRGNQTKTFSLEKLVNSPNSSSLKNHSLTLEFTSNPAWYAVQAMPYMMDYPYDCAEQTFTKFYSNALATHIMNSNPKIKAVFNAWKMTNSDELVSNLEKNQELKSALLEETPWVLDAQSETERKKRIGLLFDLNKMNNEMEQMLNKLIQSQLGSGAWPWFKGMRPNRYITQHIVTGLGHLDHLKVQEVRNNPKVWNMLKKAIVYLDQEIKDDYNQAKKHDKKYLTYSHIGNIQVQYLYARSYFKDIPQTQGTQEAFDYYLKQANEYWTQFNLYGQGMIALEAHRNDQKNTSKLIIKSLKELAIHHEEFGMYWKELVPGYYWYQAPIETQALLMEMFDEVANDQEAVEEMKIWLLKQKQTTDWKTTKATTEAVYALLMRGTDGLADNTLVNIEVGGEKVNIESSEAGTGYFKKVWHANEIQPKMGEVKVTKTTDGIGWGALYWQYFEDLDKITVAQTGLSLTKELFVVKRTDQGEVITPVDSADVHVGDKIRVRIQLASDRNLEYVHLKDMRASGLEPVSVISRYQWQGGLGYYESTKDVSTNFFMDYVPKGNYVFEYDLRVSHEGNFSNGISSIQCMYAPEFSSHSKGVRVKFLGQK